MRYFLLLLVSSLPLFAQTAIFPNGAAGDSQLKVASNGNPTTPASTLATGIGVGDTSIVVANGTIFPSNTIITIETEKISICSKSGNTLTVGTAQACPSSSGRGFDGTQPSAHGIGTPIWLYIDAWYHNATRAEIEAIESYLLARTNYKQTITNATAPVVITASTHGQGLVPTVQCWSNASPARLSACDLYMDPNTGNITLNASSISPFSGFVIISAGH
jgi:hypothetical protein